MKKGTPARRQRGNRSSGRGSNGTPPKGYHNGLLKMPLPEKPVKGAGYERLRWRKDGSLQNHDKPEEDFQNIESGLQRWFYDLLPEAHRTQQRQDFWITREAWRMFIDHLGFWGEEYVRAKALRAAEVTEKQKRGAVSAAIKRKSADKKIAEAALRAGFKKSELKLKLSRLKGLIKNGDLTMAAELFKAGEPWLLDAVLAGAWIKVVQDQWQGRSLECHTGSFFEDCDDSDLVFWVAVASAAAAGCCPASIVLEDVYDLHLRLGNTAQMELATRHVLPALPSLQQLTLEVPFSIFSTATLPPMPELSRLIINAHHVLVQSLKQQSSLQALILSGFRLPLKLEIDENQVDVFNRVRLEITQGSCSYDRSGLRDICRPPEMCGHVQYLNAPALSILLNMQRNHSSEVTPPKWWKERWISPDVLSSATGHVKDIKEPADSESAETFEVTVVDVTGQEHIHDCPLGHITCVPVNAPVTKGDVLARCQPRLLELTELDQLSVAQAGLIAESGAAVRVRASCLDAETSQLLAATSGDLHLDMDNDQAAGLVALMQVRGGLFLHFEEDVSAEIARVLSRFRGAILGVRCRYLTAPFLQQLADYPGELRLENGWPQDVLEVGVDEAKLLVERNGRVVFLGDFALSPEALGILAMRGDWDLRAYRRVLRKSGKQGESTVTLERFHRNDGNYRSKPHFLRVTRRSPSGQEKITDKFTMSATNQNFTTYLQAAAADLLQAGWEEILSDKHLQPQP
jgi:hypothetical protein